MTSSMPPTPPLEAKRLLFSEAATNRRFGEYEKKLLFVDVRKAYFNAKVDESDPVYVDLPPELAQPGMCAMLQRQMYGTRRAADGWQSEYSGSLVEFGFVQGTSSACVFVHAERGIILKRLLFTPPPLRNWRHKTPQAFNQRWDLLQSLSCYDCK